MLLVYLRYILLFLVHLYLPSLLIVYLLLYLRFLAYLLLYSCLNIVVYRFIYILYALVNIILCLSLSPYFSTENIE